MGYARGLVQPLASSTPCKKASDEAFFLDVESIYLLLRNR